MCWPFSKQKMKAVLKTFPCEDGDCIFMRLIDERKKESFHIMVDCGALSSDITDYICNVLDKRIDLLIATHIDSDHIDGITAMLANEPRLHDVAIKKIIYNCCQQIEKVKRQQAPDILNQKLEMIREMLGIENNSHISYKSSVSLGAHIAKKDYLKDKWNKTLVTEKTKCLNLGSKWGKIHFLAPTENALKRLYEKYKQEFASVTGVKIPDEPFENMEETYELFLKLDEKRKRPFKGRKIAFDGYINEQTLLDAKLEDADEGGLDIKNKASIAFVWECRGHKVLFMGDASSSVVVKSLSKRYGESLQLYDAVKIAHHGSEYNTSSDLCDIVDSHVYFLTGGSNSNGHSEECLSKILIRDKNAGFHRSLRYNVETKMMKALGDDSLEALRKEYNFDIINDCENEAFEFEY